MQDGEKAKLAFRERMVIFMKKKKLLRAVACAACAALAWNLLPLSAAADSALTVTGHQLDVVSVDPADNITYAATYSDALKAFPDGFTPGFGSSLTYKDTLPDGSVEYYGLGDRGPNVDAPNVIWNGSVYNSKFFVAPNYAPSIAVIKVSPDGKTASVEDGSIIQLKNESGALLTGLGYNSQALSLNTTSNPFKPFLQTATPSESNIGDTGEVDLDANFNLLSTNPDPNSLSTDISGLDSEGLAVDQNGNFWVSDEYGPFVVEFDSTGKEIKRLQPGSGLPGILVNRIPNRGLEDLSLTPDGKYLYVAEQSVLDIGGTGLTAAKTVVSEAVYGDATASDTQRIGSATFVRVMKIDLSTDTTIATYGYPLQASDGTTVNYGNKKNLMLGDIVALDDNNLLVLEHGNCYDDWADNNADYASRIYKFDTSNATDLDAYAAAQYGDTLAGNDTENALEFDSSLGLAGDTENPSVKLGTKTELLDLYANGWPADITKSEGFLVNPDGKTITIVNDNDFTASYSFTNSSQTDTDDTDYAITIDGSGNKIWYYNSVKDAVTKYKRPLQASDFTFNADGTITPSSLAKGAQVSNPQFQFAEAPAASPDYNTEDRNDYLLNITLSQPVMTPNSYFIPTTGVLGVPSSGTAGTALTLPAAATPSNATSTAITWSVKNAGTTGAAVSGDKLSAASAGTAVVTATVAGGSRGGDFTEDFTVEFAAASGSSGNGSSDGGSSSSQTVTVTGTTTTNSSGQAVTTASIPTSDLSSTSTATVVASLGSVQVSAPANVLYNALGGNTSATLQISQSVSPTATQQAAFQVVTTGGASPIASLDIDLNAVSSTGTATAVHQLSGSVTVTVTLTAAQLAQITNASTAHLYYYDPSTGALTDMNATFDAKAGTMTFTTSHFSTFVIVQGSVATSTTSYSPAASYSAHVQRLGWQSFVSDGTQAGTTGKSLRMEGLKLKLTGSLPTGAAILYQAHVQRLGWMSQVQDGALAGTTGKSLRLEALRISFSGLSGYAVKYRAHVQNVGWQPWVTTASGTDLSQAAVAGTTGKGLRLEAIEIEIVKVS